MSRNPATSLRLANSKSLLVRLHPQVDNGHRPNFSVFFKDLQERTGRNLGDGNPFSEEVRFLGRSVYTVNMYSVSIEDAIIAVLMYPKPCANSSEPPITILLKLKMVQLACVLQM